MWFGLLFHSPWWLQHNIATSHVLDDQEADRGSRPEPKEICSQMSVPNDTTAS